MRTQTFISSMVGVVAAVAVAGSANAAIVTGPGSGNTQGSDCATFDPSTSTTITYNGAGSWANQSFGQFYFAPIVSDSNYQGSNPGFVVTNIEYSRNSGVSWTLGASTYTTSTQNNQQAAAAGKNFAYWAFSIQDASFGISGASLRVRMTLSATNALANGKLLTGFAHGQYGSAAQDFYGPAFVAGGGVSYAVPAPGAAALVGLAGLVASRRRRN